MDQLMAQRKQLSRVEIKSEDRGEFSAVFSTFNVVDSDGDVTHPGAFDDGAEVLISSYGHQSWQGALPVGKGVIRQTKSEAVCDGQFFMDTTHGRDTFAVVKALGGSQQWSYGFDVVDSEDGQFDGRKARFLKRLKVHEVSPVLMGAGVNTRTLAVKSLIDKGYDPAEAEMLAHRATTMSEFRAAIRPHEVAVTAKRWDSAEVKELLSDAASIADLRSIHAWCDPNGDPEDRKSYKVPHHHGPDAEANLRACYMGIAQLNNGKAGIPVEDRQAVYSHLASHLQDGDREPPELRASGETGQLKLQEQTADVLLAVSELRERASGVMALRATKGKSLAAASADLLEWVYDELHQLRTVLDSPQDDAAREYLRFIQSLADPGE
jgi:HK97 family phage prohead protease